MQGRERRGQRAGQRRGVGGDAVQRPQQQRQAGALRLAVAIDIVQAPRTFMFAALGALILGRIALGALGGILAVGARPTPPGFALEAQFEGDTHAHGEEAAVEQVEILEAIGCRLRPLGLSPERHAQPVGACAHLGEHRDARVGGVHENKYRTNEAAVKASRCALGVQRPDRPDSSAALSQPLPRRGRARERSGRRRGSRLTRWPHGPDNEA